MATIAQLIERIETRLAIGSGLGVQIHAEDRITETIRDIYETVLEDHWWLDKLTLSTYTLDGTTGTVTDDLSDDIIKYEDIHSIYLNNETIALPSMTAGVSPLMVRRTSLLPSNDPTKVFKIYPSNTEGSLQVWHRIRLPESVWTNEEWETELPFDDQLIINGVCADMLIDDDTNDNSAKKFQAKFDQRLFKMKEREFQHALSADEVTRGNTATRWYGDE